MIRALLDYMGEHVSGDGAWWILGLNSILLIPLIFCRVLLSVGGSDRRCLAAVTHHRGAGREPEGSPAAMGSV